MSSAAASSSSSPPPPAAGPDKLLSLLPEILDSILSRLPLEQVIRTCCLSRAWRRRWESMPGLDLRFPPDYSAAAVANVLSRCAAPVRSFDIRVRLRHCPRAAYWLRTLASKRVRALTLSFDDSSRGEFPGVGRAIFSCEELTRLGLYHCEVPRAPQVFEGFPDLTKLVLAQIYLPFNGGGALLQRLIATGPNLAVLCLYDVSIEELPLLEEADISIDYLLGTQDFLDTFRRIASFKVL